MSSIVVVCAFCNVFLTIFSWFLQFLSSALLLYIDDLSVCDRSWVMYLLVFMLIISLYRFAPLLTSAQLSLLSPESHIVPLTEVVGLGQKMLKVSLLHGQCLTNGCRSQKGRIRNGVLYD
jgi:hypothetical protein